MPPKAETGSPLSAFSYDSSWLSVLDNPQVFVCFTILTVWSENELADEKAASASRKGLLRS